MHFYFYLLYLKQIAPSISTDLEPEAIEEKSKSTLNLTINDSNAIPVNGQSSIDSIKRHTTAIYKDVNREELEKWPIDPKEFNIYLKRRNFKECCFPRQNKYNNVMINQEKREEAEQLKENCNYSSNIQYPSDHVHKKEQYANDFKKIQTLETRFCRVNEERIETRDITDTVILNNSQDSRCKSEKKDIRRNNKSVYFEEAEFASKKNYASSCRKFNEFQRKNELDINALFNNKIDDVECIEKSNSLVSKINQNVNDSNSCIFHEKEAIETSKRIIASSNNQNQERTYTILQRGKCETPVKHKTFKDESSSSVLDVNMYSNVLKNEKYTRNDSDEKIGLSNNSLGKKAGMENILKINKDKMGKSNENFNEHENIEKESKKEKSCLSVINDSPNLDEQNKTKGENCENHKNISSNANIIELKKKEKIYVSNSSSDQKQTEYFLKNTIINEKNLGTKHKNEYNNFATASTSTFYKPRTIENQNFENRNPNLSISTINQNKNHGKNSSSIISCKTYLNNESQNRYLQNNISLRMHSDMPNPQNTQVLHSPILGYQAYAYCPSFYPNNAVNESFTNCAPYTNNFYEVPINRSNIIPASNICHKNPQFNIAPAHVIVNDQSIQSGENQPHAIKHNLKSTALVAYQEKDHAKIYRNSEKGKELMVKSPILQASFKGFENTKFAAQKKDIIIDFFIGKKYYHCPSVPLHPLESINSDYINEYIPFCAIKDNGIDINSIYKARNILDTNSFKDIYSFHYEIPDFHQMYNSSPYIRVIINGVKYKKYFGLRESISNDYIFMILFNYNYAHENLPKHKIVIGKTSKYYFLVRE